MIQNNLDLNVNLEKIKRRATAAKIPNLLLQ